MADLIPSKSPSIKKLMQNLSRYKHNPSNIQRTVYDYLDEVLDGKVDIVDPTNPFIFLLESSAVNTALAVNENIAGLRQQYASLSQTEDELYHHMVDVDYLDRFSKPSEVTFTIVVSVNDIMSKLVFDASENCHKVTIPRDTEFMADTIPFTLQYPINIRRFENGVVQISYDANIQSPVERLRGNLIDYTIRSDANGTQWLSFDVRVKQMKVSPVYFPLENSKIFKETVNYNDKFFYLRAFQRNLNTENKWEEIRVTHSDQVFDPFYPTVLAKVKEGSLDIEIPHVYLSTALMSGSIRFDVYTTKGDYTSNLATYKLDNFGMELRAIDDVRDINEFTNAWSSMTTYVFSDKIVNGGHNGIDFKTLRERVIYNSTGPQILPITNVQIESSVENHGFELVKNVDVLTNRVFLALKELPTPSNEKLLTPANTGIATWIVNLDAAVVLDGVIDNNDRLTVKSNQLFKSHNDVISLVPQSEIDYINSLEINTAVAHINNSRYVYNPYYYVLDKSGLEFEVRPYNLDDPVTRDLSFLRQNQTLQLAVNTDGYNIEKTSYGYRIVISTRSGTFYKEVPDSQVFAQLAFYPEGESHLAYINGEVIGYTDDGERIYSFEIHTNHDLNDKDHLCITNAKMFNNDPIKVWTSLSKEMYILHSTTSVTSTFTPDLTDSLIGKAFLPNGVVGNTHESLMVEFGTPLKNLWSRTRILASGLEYRRRDFDVPMLYDRDVYDIDPVTNSIFRFDEDGNLVYNKIHSAGDPVLDEDGDPVYRYRKGDVELDEDGRPILKSPLEASHEIDILFVDGKHYFANDPAYVAYRKELRDTLTEWITDDITSIQDNLLEQSKIFFHPVTTMGRVHVYVENDGEAVISSEQSFSIEYIVKESIYKDDSVRSNIEQETIRILNERIGGLEFNTTEVINELKSRLGEGILSIKMYGLGGASNYSLVRIANEHNKLCLKKKLVVQTDLSLIVKEDVNIQFSSMRDNVFK